MSQISFKDCFGETTTDTGISCQIPNEILISLLAINELFKTILYFILYQKCYSPLPFENLDDLVQVIHTKQQQKLNKWVENILDILNCCSALFESEIMISRQCILKSIIILLGPSVTCGKEIYKIDIQNTKYTQENKESVPRVGLIENLKRMIVRKLVSQNFIIDSKSTVKYSMFIGIELTEISSKHGKTEACFEKLPEIFLEKFSYRENFGQKLPKKVLLKRIQFSSREDMCCEDKDIGTCSSKADIISDGDIDSNDIIDDLPPSHWFILRKAIKQVPI